MVRIIDTRQMSRAERLAVAEASDKERADERARIRREHAERNAAALKAQQEWLALSPGARALRRRQDQAQKMARHAEANAAAEAKAAPGPPENKMLLPAVENKSAPKARPVAVVGSRATFAAREPTVKATPATVKVKVEQPTEPDATDAARKLAKEHRVSLSDIEGTGVGGRVTMSDVQAFVGK